jgi:hypothetical protein
MNYDVVNVVAVGPLHLSVTFRDGLCGEVVFKESHLDGVFAALKKPDIFAKVNCKNGFVEWPGQIDLAPDAMYDEVKQKGVWELA